MVFLAVLPLVFCVAFMLGFGLGTVWQKKWYKKNGYKYSNNKVRYL